MIGKRVQCAVNAMFIADRIRFCAERNKKRAAELVAGKQPVEIAPGNTSVCTGGAV